MAAPQTEAPTSLRITRTFPAPREKVFQAWTDPEGLKKWFAPSDQFVTRVPELEAKPGGRYRIEMESEGKTHTAVGVYREVRPPEKLVFTWRWETDPERGGETVVTIELFDRGGKTELVLTHEGFPTESLRDEHNKGWTGCLTQLEKYLS
jgi:uncharacterized protein YndB with AHSA1/START domain